MGIEGIERGGGKVLQWGLWKCVVEADKQREVQAFCKSRLSGQVVSRKKTAHWWGTVGHGGSLLNAELYQSVYKPSEER